MELSNKILSDITVFNKYAKYLVDKQRRETWDEICDRYQNMMVEKYPSLTNDIKINMQLVRDKKILPSMRAMQFAGPAINKNNSRIYNCAFLPVDDYRAFSEAMFLLLGGTGVGYSVQFHHIEKLPEITKPTKERKYLVSDSLEGWADAIKELMKSYFGITKYKPRFDFSDIRPKGARLVTAGGKAPGPGPLKICIAQIESILESKVNGDKLKPIDCHDILCHIANSVLSGGIRRSAMISLFSFDDEEMLECKYGNWWETNEQRGRANNSAVIIRNKITKSEFDVLWKKIELSNSGEPGMYFSNDKDWGTNP
jgi:ribonucleoside-diphosphate reductase alpha chain